MCISIPRGAKGYLLKSCTPLRTVFEDTIVLTLENLNRFTYMSICGSILSHKNKGAAVGKPLNTPIACNFHVCIPLSAMLRRCCPFGTNSYSVLFSKIASFSSCEHSLSKMCFFGLIPFCFRRFISAW